jgi:uncharacterized protein YgiM (DUF1202 family)
MRLMRKCKVPATIVLQGVYMKRRTFIRLGGLGLLSSVATLAMSQQAEAAPASIATPVICIESCGSINIRTGASIRSRKIGTLYNGETANVYALSADRNWWCIQFGRGRAWINADPGLTKPIAWRR